MVRSTIKSGTGYIWIPTSRENINTKIVVTKSGTEYDLSTVFKSISVNKPLLVGLQSASVVLDNNDGNYLNFFSGGEKIEIWCEYNDTPATYTKKIYRGKVDFPSFSLNESDGYIVTLNTRQCPEANDDKVIEQYYNMLIHDAIRDIVNKYLSGIVTLNNLSETTVRVTTNYNGQSPWQVIADLLTRAEQYGYIDTDLDLHTFDRESVTNTTDRIGINYNVLGVSNYELDNTQLKNKVVVTGKNDNNMLILKTEENTTSQSALWKKTEFINKSNLETMEEVQEEADLSLRKLTTDIVAGGSIPIVGSPLLNPGELIKASIPGCGINADKTMTNITHTITPNDFTTTIELSSTQNSIGKLFQERIDAENSLKTVDNLNYMRDSYNVFFTDDDVDKVTLTNCEVVEGILQLSSGQTEGECLSDTYSVDSNITKIECRTHTNFETANDIITVSNDGGISWITIVPGEVKEFISTGKLFKFKILLNKDSDNNPRYEAITFLFS